MGTERKAVVFYRNFYEAIKDLPVELKAEVYDAVMEYGLNGEEPASLSLMAKSIFALIKPSIDTNNTRYENGKNGGRPRKGTKQNNEDVVETEEEVIKTEQKPNENQIKTEPEPANNINNEYENENINNNIIQEDEPPLALSVRKEEKVGYEKIVKRFNEQLTPMLPKVVIITDGRKNAIKSILNKHGPDAIDVVFEKAKRSSFLQGDNDRGFKCSFDWIFKPSNFVKILEGNYDNENRRRINKTESESPKLAANEIALQGYIDYCEQQPMAMQMERPF